MPSPCWADCARHFTFSKPHLTLTPKSYVSILRMKNLKLREIKKLVQVHTACKGLKNICEEGLAGAYATTLPTNLREDW